MKNLIINSNSVLTTTSKIIADVFGKPHRSVLKAIKDIDCSDEFSLHNFMRSEYKTERGKTYSCYNITEQGFYFLCMGFTGKKAAKWREEFISEFGRLRNGSLRIDQRMNEIAIRLKKIKQDGSEWSSIGREINKQKKEAVKMSNKLIDDVQMKLEI
jgi:Rha family phage regulatory protein